MNSKRSVWHKLLYGDVDKSFYSSYNEFLVQFNYKNMKITFMLATIFSLILTTMNLFSRENRSVSILYLLSMLGFGISSFLLMMVPKKNKSRIMYLLYWIFIILVYANAVYLSTISDSSNLAVVFFPIMLVASLAYIEPPFMSFVEITFGVGLFLLFEFLNKSGAILERDLLNLVWAYPLSLIFNFYLKYSSVSHIESTMLFKKEAQVDRLTHVFNKSTAQSYIEETLNGKHNDLAMIIFDIKSFSTINQKWGYNQGDTLLSRCGRVLKNVFDDYSIIGRIGADQFVVFVDNIFDKNIIITRIKQVLTNFSNVFSDYSSDLIETSCGCVFVDAKEKIKYNELYNLTISALRDAKLENKGERVKIYEGDLLKKYNSKPIMIVADKNDVSRELIRNIFEQKYSIIETDDGNDVVELFKNYSSNISFIISDFEVKNMTAVELLSILKTQPRYDDVGKLIFSSFDEMELKLLQLGADDVLKKPIDLEVIRYKVQNIERRL